MLKDVGTVVPASPPANRSAAGRDVTIGVSTVGFTYLERKEIITRASDSQLTVHQPRKWGSAPKEDFALDGGKFARPGADPRRGYTPVQARITPRL